MIDLTLILLIASAGYAVSRWLRLPVIPLMLLGGVLVSLARVDVNVSLVAEVLELGLVFLVFGAGVELNPQRFKRHRSAVIWIAFVQFMAVGVLGFLLAKALRFEHIAALYIGFALATSSTLVVLRHLRQNQLVSEPFGRLVIGVLLLQDLIIIVAIITLGKVPEGLNAVALGLGSGLLLMGLAYGCHQWLMPWLIVKRGFQEETVLITILALLFVFVRLAIWMDLAPVVGAFLAGVGLSSFPVNGLVRAQLRSIADFFSAIFFTSLGCILIWPDWTGVFQAVCFAALVIAATPPLVAILAEWKGLTARTAIESGLLLAQASEFSIVVSLTGLGAGYLNMQVFSVITLTTIITMMLTPFLARDEVVERLVHLHPFRKRPAGTDTPKKDHVLVLGFGAGGMWAVKPLLKQGYEVLVVDDDPVIIHQLERSNIPCLYGDGSDPSILKTAGAKQARLILAGMRRVRDSEKVIRHVKPVPVVVRVFESAQGDLIRKAGGVPILNSKAAADTFMEWFDKAIKG